EHTVNVTALTLQYCFFYDLPESETQKLSLAAMLHDVGCAKIEKKLIESQKKLSDKQFATYTTHPGLGHETIRVNANFDIAISKVAMEHHERIDGSGYPQGLRGISAYAQLIGLIDCYEHMTYRSKRFRKKKKPYETLSIIKDELSQKKFSKDIFKRFTACLVR
ncbi:MAG: HD domain-containing protein, partial [Chlorobiales bacterium]|nr:HD domain-containing protein [Chlorobiales bacterium]